MKNQAIIVAFLLVLLGLVTTIKANVFDKVVVATAKTKASKEPRAQKGSKAPVYTKGSKVAPKSSDDEDCRGAKAKSGKTCNPSSEPSSNPSEQPSLSPSDSPSDAPSDSPSLSSAPSVSSAPSRIP